MPEMYEIYDQHAHMYHELVSHEDYRENLRRFLLEKIEWNNKIVYEAGIGTGRVAGIYLPYVKTVYGFDRAKHMIEYASRYLNKYAGKLHLGTGNNKKLPVIDQRPDIFIQGWSFGHLMMDEPQNVSSNTEHLVNQCRAIMGNSGVTIFIETLGTFTNEPGAPAKPLEEFYSILEKNGFNRYVLETGYRFNDVQHAADVMGFFFGDVMRDKILAQDKVVIPEYTGVWISRNS